MSDEAQDNRIRVDALEPFYAEAADRWAVIFGDPDEIDLTAPISAAVQSVAIGPPLRIADATTGDALALAWRIRAP